MAQLKINQLEEVQRYIEVQEPLWLNADRSKVLAEGDPEAAFLLATPGKRLSIEEAERYGLLKARKPASSEEKAK